MVNRNLIRDFDVSDDEIEREIQASLGAPADEALPLAYVTQEQEFDTNKIVVGTVREIRDDEVFIDIGYKSDGYIRLDEWRDEGTDKVVPPQVGEKVRVLLDVVDDESGLLVLSYKKARRQEEWERVIQQHKEGDVVTGMVTKKIKGGLLVNIGVNVFLPASQVDIRRPSDIGDYLNREVRCKILKIDEARRNIVVSRRKLIEDEREEKKKKLLAEIAPTQVRKGVVKNIADFGAFVDLGGIDGLLHITDMSWGRIQHPSDMVHIDQELEVYIINVDKDKERIAVGLKQKQPSPWVGVEQKYPVNSRHQGEVVNIMTYGAFVKLEPGIEGLVHISEMSWTKRINHPNEMVSIGDKIEVQVLNINKEKQEISLGMKQCLSNPWEKVAERYPQGTVVKGVVRNLTNYGAFVEIEEGIDGLLHVSDMSWVRKVSHPNEVLQKGQEVTCVVLSVDQDRKRIALGLKQLASDPWETDIPGRYKPNQVVNGKVTKITNFGVFVELEEGLEGLLHISELAEHKIENPEEVVKVGDTIEIKVLRVDSAERKIGLSRKRTTEEGEEEPPIEGDDDSSPAKKERELKGGMGGASGPLFSMPEAPKPS
ncbi:MAG TPA: 30S ribosomal protein S1 [Gemmatales bacterium]|nr:30S ribosomal protein S1 [Gemmatales bacterium]